MSEDHHFYPLADIQASTPLKQGLLDHIMIFENYPIDESLRRLAEDQPYEMRIDKIDFFEHSNYDFEIMVFPGDRIRFDLKFNGHVYEQGQIEGIEGHLRTAIDCISRNENIKVEDIDILTEGERQQLLMDFSDTNLTYPQDKTIVDLFEEQTEKTPDKDALVFEDKTLSLACLGS